MANPFTLEGSWLRCALRGGRLGYPLRAEVLEVNDDGLIVAARLARPASAYGRAEIEDAQGRKAWTNPLWI